MARVSIFHPIAGAYREADDADATKFVHYASLVEEKLNSDPSLDKVSIYDPALDVFYEVSRDVALQFIDSAKNVKKLLGL